MSEPAAGQGTLYLIPVSLGAGDPASVLPPATLDAVRGLDTFFAENAKSARQFLKGVAHPRALRDVDIRVLDEHSGDREVESLLALLRAGRHCGLMSEAGCPGVADPGAVLVRRAHASGVRVTPLVGPSSVLLAVMASGMNGQRFAFHGYLPVPEAERRRKLVELERAARAQDAAQVFIETPYRNMALLQSIVEACHAETLLCIAADLTLPGEMIRTQPVRAWRGNLPDLARRPAVFLIYRPT